MCSQIAPYESEYIGISSFVGGQGNAGVRPERPGSPLPGQRDHPSALSLSSALAMDEKR